MRQKAIIGPCCYFTIQNSNIIAIQCSNTLVEKSVYCHHLIFMLVSEAFIQSA